LNRGENLLGDSNVGGEDSALGLEMLGKKIESKIKRKSGGIERIIE